MAFCTPTHRVFLERFSHVGGLFEIVSDLHQSAYNLVTVRCLAILYTAVLRSHARLYTLAVRFASLEKVYIRDIRRVLGE